jgi:hypothetical protein
MYLERMKACIRSFLSECRSGILTTRKYLIILQLIENALNNAGSLAGLSGQNGLEYTNKTEKEFLKYINVTKEETARNLSNHVYFIEPKMKIV